MEHHDGESAPLSTLLVRVAIGADAWQVAATCWSAEQVRTLQALDGVPLGADHDPVLGLIWLGDVVVCDARPLAAALVRVDVQTATAVVLAVHSPEPSADPLRRLAVGLVEAASSRGCTTLRAGDPSTVDADPERLLRASGLRPVTDARGTVYSIER